jgi:hypothetical protein
VVAVPLSTTDSDFLRRLFVDVVTVVVAMAVDALVVVVDALVFEVALFLLALGAGVSLAVVFRALLRPLVLPSGSTGGEDSKPFTGTFVVVVRVRVFLAGSPLDWLRFLAGVDFRFGAVTASAKIDSGPFPSSRP